jgi:hypothetical protein
MKKIESLTETQASEVFEDVAAQIERGLSRAIFSKLSILLYRTPSLVPAFVASRLLNSIDWSEPSSYEVNLRILLAVVNHDITVLTVDIVTALTGLVSFEDSAGRFLKLWAVFVSRSDQHPTPEPLLQVLIGSSALYMEYAHYIHILYSVYSRFPDLRAEILPIFRAGVNSPSDPVVRASYYVFANVKVPVVEVPLGPIIASIREGALVNLGIEILARLEYVPASNRLVAAVLSTGQTSPLSIVVLCRLAMSAQGGEILACNPGWLAPDIFPAEDSLRLLLAVGQHAGPRNALTDAPGYPQFLSWIVADAPPKDMAAVVPLLRRTQLSDEFIRALQSARFFATFFPRAIKSGDLAAIDASIMLVDKVARVLWVDGFVAFIRELPTLFRVREIQEKAVIAALLLTTHTESTRSIASMDLVPILREIDMDAAFEPYKRDLMRRVA